jgi:hypothetical protein
MAGYFACMKGELTILTFIDRALVSQGIQLNLERIDRARGVPPGRARP